MEPALQRGGRCLQNCIKKFHFVAMATRVFDGIKFWEQFFNPLTNNKTLDMTKLKAFADDKLNVAEMKDFSL